MKSLALALFMSFAIPAFAQIAPSTEGLDHGIVAGALFSKKFEAKAGAYTYNIIAADLEEPACNSIQVVVFIVDDQVEGSGAVTYNLGLQVSGVVSVKSVGKSVILKLRRNEVEDCTKSVIDTYKMEYSGSGSDLTLIKQ